MNALRLPKIAVIAGVGSGLGAALARRFVRGGCSVVLFARSSEYIEALAAELNAQSKSDVARAIGCDLADPQQISAAFAKVRKEIGLVDVLVNHASGGGGPTGSSLLNLDPQAWRVGVPSLSSCDSLFLCGHFITSISNCSKDVRRTPQKKTSGPAAFHASARSSAWTCD